MRAQDCSLIIRHTVSSTEQQNSAVWLMLQPHPLDQRHNYIVIDLAGSLKPLMSTVLSRPFV